MIGAPVNTTSTYSVTLLDSSDRFYFNAALNVRIVHHGTTPSKNVGALC